MSYLDDLVEDYLSRGGKFEYSQKQLLQIHALTMERVIEPHKVGVYRQDQVVIRGVKMERWFIDHLMQWRFHIRLRTFSYG